MTIPHCTSKKNKNEIVLFLVYLILIKKISTLLIGSQPDGAGAGLDGKFVSFFQPVQ